MFIVLALLFLILPVLEIWAIVNVAGGIGWLDTVGLLVLISIAGAWMVRREGVNVIRRVQQQLAGGKMPAKELVDGALIVFAGALMLTPGFITDAVGLLLLFPPTRAVVRAGLMRRFKNSVQVWGAIPGARASGHGFGLGRGPDIDVSSTERDVVDLWRSGDGPDDDVPPLGR